MERVVWSDGENNLRILNPNVFIKTGKTVDSVVIVVVMILVIKGYIVLEIQVTSFHPPVVDRNVLVTLYLSHYNAADHFLVVVSFDIIPIILD